MGGLTHDKWEKNVTLKAMLPYIVNECCVHSYSYPWSVGLDSAGSNIIPGQLTNR